MNNVKRHSDTLVETTGDYYSKILIAQPCQRIQGSDNIFTLNIKVKHLNNKNDNRLYLGLTHEENLAKMKTDCSIQYEEKCSFYNCFGGGSLLGQGSKIGECRGWQENTLGKTISCSADFNSGEITWTEKESGQ